MSAGDLKTQALESQAQIYFAPFTDPGSCLERQPQLLPGVLARPEKVLCQRADLTLHDEVKARGDESSSCIMQQDYSLKHASRKAFGSKFKITHPRVDLVNSDGNVALLLRAK